MPNQKDGFLTLLSIRKGWKNIYNKLKWLWISVSAAGGIILGLLTWLYNPHLVIPASIVGTLVGAALFFLVLKSISPERQEK